MSDVRLWRKLIIRSSIAVVLPTQSAQGAVLWMDQARRLQEISATLLDTYPVAVPIPLGLSLGMRSDVSFLPVPNGRVGAKIEKLPSAPIQTIPLISASAGADLGGSEALSFEIWGGYLPPGGEKLFGISASLSQNQIGGRLQATSARIGQARFGLAAGVVRTSSILSGTISSATGKDQFSANSVLKFAEITAQHSKSGLWAGVSAGSKNTTSRLAIVEDETDLSVTDTLSNARQPYWTQFTLGLLISSGLSIALSELVVPDRIEMPRLSLTLNLFNLSGARRE